MGRLFDGINDSLTAAVDLSAHTTVSVAFWLWWDAFATDNDLAMEFGADGTTSGSRAFAIDPNDGTGTISTWCAGTGNAAAYTWTRPSAAAWHHYCFIFNTSGNPILFYLDGVAQTAASGSVGVSGGTFTSGTLNFMSRNNASLFAPGRMAEAGIWGFALSTPNIAHLGTDKWAPSLLGSTAHYWKMDGTASPEPDTGDTGGADATVNGAVSTAHPPGIVYTLGGGGSDDLLLLLSRRQDSRAG